MSIIDLLLQADVEKLEEISKREVEIPRLSEKLGTKFIVTCGVITNKTLKEISEFKNFKVKCIMKSCKINGEIISFNEAIREKYKADSDEEVIEKLLLCGEISGIYDIINELSGYGKDSVIEIKN